MLVGALDFVQRDVPEILIDRWPERDPKQVTVKVNGQQRSFSIERVDAPWSLRSTLQEIFRFVQPNLQPVPEKEEARRLVEIEMAATNGMLYTLDPHSVLLDVETYKDMRTQTQGKFGGLGIVIEMDKKNRITVKRPMPDTPAIRVGIKAKDHIVRINNESTMNMTLNEAVERLRGDVDTNVDVYVERDTAPGVKKFTITRAFIRPPSIDPPARVLSVPAGPGRRPAKIGYFHLQHFSANSASDLGEALQMFEKEKVKGIIMDLRGNPGGLYEQAQKVADAFIEIGDAGVDGRRGRRAAQGRDRDQERPRAQGPGGRAGQPELGQRVGDRRRRHEEPGSRRGHRRGDLRQGLGAGAVRHPVADLVRRQVRGRQAGAEADHGAVPDAGRHLDPGGGRDPRHRDRRPAGSEGRRAVLDPPAAVVAQAARVRLRMAPRAPQRATRREAAGDGLVPLRAEGDENKRAPRDDDEETAVDPDEPAEPEEDADLKTDFLMDFARDFLAQAKTIRRRELVSGSKAFLDKVRANEDKKLSQALEKLGVDWAAGAGAGRTGAQQQLTLQPVGTGEERPAKIPAGSVAKVRGTVKNTGTTPAYRVRALLESDNPIFDENEMVFGKIGPGESKTYDLSVKVPPSSFTRTDVLKGTLFSQRGGAKANSAEMVLNIEGKARPMFAYNYQTIDDQKGSNRDGQVQRGEQVRTLVTVKNIGAGPRACAPRRCCATAPARRGS